jgi:general secretion pathway protein J
MCRNNNGFTLIEVLVALALMVILTGALYGTYFSVVRARERGGARSEARRELSSTLGMLRNEIASSFFLPDLASAGTPTQGNNGSQGGNASQAATNPGQNLQFVVEDRDSFGNPASLLQFTAITPPKAGSIPSSDVEAVRYSVIEKEGVLTLAKESKDLYLQVKSSPFPVIDNIEAFQVECYNGSQWVKTWDTALTHKLPDDVRVTVTLKGGDKFAVIAAPGLIRKSLGTGSLGSLGSLPKIPGLSTGQQGQPQ